MSEKAPSTSVEISTSNPDFDQLDMRTYKNGAKHVYSKDKDGKKRHISNNDVLASYGYNPDGSKIEGSNDTQDVAGTVASATSETSKSGIRPIEDGEFERDLEYGPENSDPNHPDYLPTGVMAIEPHTFADPTETTNTTSSSENEDNDEIIIDDGGVVPTNVNTGERTRVHESVDKGDIVRFRDKNGKLREWEVRSIGNVDKDGDRGVLLRNTDGSGDEHIRTYEGLLDALEEGPVEGSATGATPEVDPRTRIGEAINTRMNELMENGMSEEDAHAQAHDEFWGGDIHNGNETDDDDEETPEQVTFVPSQELVELTGMLKQAQDRYAEATSRSRNSTFGRFLKEDSKFMGIVGKLTGMQALINKLKNSEKVQNWTAENDSNREFFGDAETIDAKEEYERLYEQVSMLTGQEVEAAGMSAELAQAWAMYSETERDKDLAFDIADRREANSKSTNGFVNWWVNAKGWKGKLAKAGLVGAAGIAAGVGIGIAGGGFLAAAIAGGVTGNAIAGYVTKRRANSISKETGRTLAQDQAVGDHAIATADIQASYAVGKDSVSPSESVARTEQTTDDEMIGNRRRRRAAIAIGKLGATLGMGGLKHFTHDKPKDPTTPKPKDPKTPTPKDPTPTPKPPETPDVAPKPPTPEVPRPQFDVEPGSGFEREISQYFANNGKPISGSEAHKLYQSLEQTYGPNGLIKPSETYLRSGTDYGISRPGMYEVADGPAKVLSDWLAAK